jgi:hypothetical protein
VVEVVELRYPDGRPVIDYMARDYDSLLRAMRALIPDKLPEWTEYAAEGDFGNVLLELFAHMGDILSYYQDRVAGESFLGTAQTRRSVIQHLALIGYRLATAVPAATTLQLTVPVGKNGLVQLPRGAAFATAGKPGRPSVRFEYNAVTPLVIDLGTLTADPADPTRKTYVDGIPVEEGRLIADEVAGVSDGTPDQRFRLQHPRVVLRATGPRAATPDVIVRTVQAGTVQDWTQQRNLAFSLAQPDFVVEIDEDDRATIRFGDGTLTGAVPPKNSTVQVTYRVGGGPLGNVAAHSIETIVDATPLAPLGAKVTNPAPATGGADRESIEHAATNAPAVFRSLERAVTAEDYRALALTVNGVGKVRVVADRRNVVTLYVAPSAAGGHVSDVLTGALLSYFADRRPVNTVVEIADVDYVPVYVAATVGIDGYYSRAAVTEAVLASAGALLSFDAVDFAEVVYLSKFYEAIEAVPGVAYATVTEFTTSARTPPVMDPGGKLTLGPNEIPVAAYPGGLAVTPEGGY